MSRSFLEGSVIDTTDRAVRFERRGTRFWIPRSVCADGEHIKEGDTEIEVADWFLEKEDIAP